jgi:hypothetical protein
VSDDILDRVGHSLRTQDNRITANPMFCVQVSRRVTGIDTDYTDKRCWHNIDSGGTIYDDDADFAGAPEGEGWDEFGYQDCWETVMVAFTEDGCKEYLRLNGHNLRKPRIYVMSFNRCPEMIAIREHLMKRGGVQ